MGIRELLTSDSLRTGTRVLQVVWSVIQLGCSAYLVATWLGEIEDLDVNPTRYTSPACFSTSVACLCLAAAALFLGASRAGDRRVQRALPGAVDLAASGLLLLLSLVSAGAVGTSFAMHVSCHQAAYAGDLEDSWWLQRVCSVSRAAVAAGVALSVLFAVSAVAAFLDMRDGKGLLPRSRKAPAAVDVNEAPEGDADLKAATSLALEAEEGKHRVDAPA